MGDALRAESVGGGAVSEPAPAEILEADVVSARYRNVWGSPEPLTVPLGEVARRRHA